MSLSEELAKEIREDIVAKYALILLSALNESSISGKTSFVKTMFLISKNKNELYEEADFIPDNYGPSSDYVIDIYNRLIEYSVARLRKGKIEITPLGRRIFEILKRDVKKNEFDMISEMKELCSDLTNDELLGLIYFTYPDMTTESLVKEEIENKRLQISLSLLKKEKISIGKAAEIAGFSVDNYYNYIKKKESKYRVS